MLNQMLVSKDNKRNDLSQQLSTTKNNIDTAKENKKIYDEIIAERRRFLMSSYLMKGQDDLEIILETLHDHFKLIKLTSFEELARNNIENLTAKQLLDMSNDELK